MESKLVKINKRRKAEKKEGISRRSFIKSLGAAGAAGIAGCADNPAQKILPFVKGDTTQIPGVAVWYSSTCKECSAGCGIQVRTREGRAVKIEGNRENPVNRGGLCALGQAALQSLYDPDRIREPLKKVSEGGREIFKPISWEDAFSEVAEALKEEGYKAFLAGELTGTVADLWDSWCQDHDIQQAVYDPMQPVDLARASELTFGHYGIPKYNFEKAEVIVSFGADFLETWISPVEYARGWAAGRKPGNVSRVIHIEPRLSLTAANADKWIRSKPGSETAVALAVLKLLVERGNGKNLSESVINRLKKLVSKVNIEEVAYVSGIKRSTVLLIADYLHQARSSLVLAGGPAASKERPLGLFVAVNFINMVLKNVGRTVDISRMRKPRTSVRKVSELVAAMDKAKVKTLLVYATNPAFSLPQSYNFRYAAKKVSKIISFASHMDETAKLADIILPAHHSLEEWGDAHPFNGVYGLTQPVMRPVFNTRSFGDMLITLSEKSGNKKAAYGAANFEEYLKNAWKKIHVTSGSAESFKSFWLKAVERGGYFEDLEKHIPVRVSVKDEAYTVVAESFKEPEHDHGLMLYAYPSVRSFDGRAANRPWLQELPDPVTKIVWDSWAEIHPETAGKAGIKNGDLVAVRNKYGDLKLAAYITENVDQGIVAVPLGQGHTEYGRYARLVKGGNVYDLLQTGEDSDGVVLLGSHVEIKRLPGRPKLVNTQGSDSQHGRGLARTAIVAATAASHSNGHNGGHHAHQEGHHEIKQMYVQREHPVYEWGMVVDLAACTGCSACVVACYAENNIAVVGKDVCWQGREMSWLRIDRYYEKKGEELRVSFQPMMCQHCNNAPCEPVCPVYATYHNEDGLNVMVYNRCVGTRYCSNNCTYKVRRYNWYEFKLPEPLNWQVNPDVTKRTAGVMEKCTFCIQRINEAKDIAKDQGRLVEDGEIQPACVQSCPTEALVFGNLKDPNSRVSRLAKSGRGYKVLDHHINTQPSVTYLEDLKWEIT
ncbi:MAG: 4Fe-4S dicluster domain-containing protein [Candidatus Dadabacteria bacterium]|nr:MAG: 4Fe-4S dicluster domain-containing protein [Candidatus Dadabacteria bacterium]